jgi:hypothetical protein
MMLVTGYCARCGHYWELDASQRRPPAHVYMNVHADGGHTVKILCVNVQTCGRGAR